MLLHGCDVELWIGLMATCPATLCVFMVPVILEIAFSRGKCLYEAMGELLLVIAYVRITHCSGTKRNAS